MSKFTQFWKSDISKKGHVATAEERKKDPYLSADSMVYDDDEDSEKSDKDKGPSDEERERMQAEIKAHAKKLPPEKPQAWHGNWD